MNTIKAVYELEVGDEMLCGYGHVQITDIMPSVPTAEFLLILVAQVGNPSKIDKGTMLPEVLLDAIDNILWVKRGGQTIYQKPAVVDNPSKFYGMGQPAPLTCALPEDPWVGIEDCPAEWKDGRVVLGYDDSVSVSNGSHGIYPIFWAETLYGRQEGLFWATDDIYQEPFFPTWVRPMIELPAGRRKT